MKAIRQKTTASPKLDIEAGRFRLELSKRIYIMGVINMTPDSFYDGGKFFVLEKAVERAFELARLGADIIDIGGESTRPGAAGVSAHEECDRILPLIEKVSGSIKIPVSIDTRKSEVAKAALEAGASIVNDVSGLNFDNAISETAARHKSALILMHMKGTPGDMQKNPHYGDLIGEIIESLKRSIENAVSKGVSRDRIIIDPGVGFGKTVEHNLEIIRRLDEFKVLKRPICIGTSRKSFIGKILGIDNTGDRLAGSLATYAIAVANGANILRVHDVKEASHAARITESICTSSHIVK